MAELMGICGADGEALSAALDRMASAVDRSGGLRLERWEAEGLGLLRFHHGVINAGPQPVQNEDGSLLAAMDGEVFGTDEARALVAAAGHRFRDPASHAELVLHLYEQCGEEAFRRLTGSYSVCVYEPAVRRLLLVTDRFFSRPLYYCHRGGMLAFTSRFNALVASGALEGGRLNMTSLMQMFTLQNPLGTNTHYAEARAMPPAAVLEFRNERLSLRRYWRPRYSEETLPDREWAERLAAALRRSARRTTGDAARKGIMLSGGLDSRSLAAATDAPLRAYTVGDGPNREVRTACEVARVKGWPHTFLRRAPDHYFRLLDEAVELTGGMARFDDCQFLGLLGAVRSECDVVFIEEPMGSLVKGVYWDRYLDVMGRRIPLPWVKRADRAGLAEQVLAIDVDSMLPAKPWLLFRDPWRSRYREMMCESVRVMLADLGPADPYSAIEYARATSSIGRLSAFTNVTCVRPYLEYRSFCLDADLFDLALRMPARLKMGARALRAALRLLSPGLHAIPYANTGASLGTPGAVSWAYEMGGELARLARKHLGLIPATQTNESWPDRAEVLRTEPLRSVLEETIADAACFPPEVFDSDRLRRILRDHLSGRRHYMRTLLCLLTFGRWFRRYGPSAV